MIVSLGDSEKALSSLPSPLTATDETSLSKGGGFDTIKVTAGLHRQVWVSGTDIFVDVHLANNSRKAIRRLDLSLERNILCYRHAAAATRERSASQARIFESNERAILSRSSLKHDTNGWKGVDAYSTDTRTCQLELPRGHATVKCGKYFEVRYFLNVAISTSHTKLVSVQLPLILIHMNSLDVVPNSVAQVAAAIEEKRHRASRSHSRHASRSNTRTPHSRGPSTPSPAKANTSLYRNPSRLQGRAFAAPRQQSLDRMRAEAADLEQLGAILDSSPRKHAPRAATPAAEPSNAPKKMASMFSLGNISVDSYSILGGGLEYQTPPSKRKGRLFDGALSDEVEAVRERLRSMRSFDSFRSRKSAAPHSSSRKGKEKENVFPVPARPLGAGLFDSSSPTAQTADDGVGDPIYNHSVLGKQDLGPQSLGAFSFGPHALGLRSHVHAQHRLGNEDGVSGAAENEGKSAIVRMPSWRLREKLDKSRFEFKAVRRKGSGGLKEWWDGKRGRDRERGKDREGWI